VVALAVLGTAFTVLLAAHTSATRLSAHARRLFEATALAREVLTRTEVEGLPAFGKDSGDFGPDLASYRWEREVGDVTSLPFLDLKEVVVRVLWSEGQQTRSTEVVFYYLKKDTT
jgi:hypothetical protein